MRRLLHHVKCFFITGLGIIIAVAIFVLPLIGLGIFLNTLGGGV